MNNKYDILVSEDPVELSATITKLNKQDGWQPVEANPTVFNDSNDADKQKIMLMVVKYEEPLTVIIEAVNQETGPGNADGSFTAVAIGGSIGDGVINGLPGLLDPGSGYAVDDIIDIVDSGGSGTGGQIRVDAVVGDSISVYTVINKGTEYVGPFTFSGGSGAGADFEIIPGKQYNPYNSNTFEFSINEVEWQSSGTFDVLDDGDYTVYVRDADGNTGKGYVRITTA